MKLFDIFKKKNGEDTAGESRGASVGDVFGDAGCGGDAGGTDAFHREA